MSERPGTTMATSPKLGEIVVRRWLIALALASTAEDLAARLSPVTAGVALVSADTAAEAILGILADQSGQVPGVKDPHEQLVQRALTTAADVGAPLSPGLVRAIRLTHGRRNSIIHQGDDAGPRDVEEAQIVVRGLLEVLNASIPMLTLLPAGAGPLRAVSTLVDVPELAERMVAAEGRLVAGELAGARESASIALGMTLQRVVPPLSYEGPAYRFRADRRDQRDQQLELSLDAADRRTRVLSGWVVPLALGMPPAEYARLDAVLGEAYETGDGWHTYPRTDPPDETDLQWALPQLARVVFRLWEMQSLQSKRR